MSLMPRVGMDEAEGFGEVNDMMKDWWDRHERDIKGCWPILVIIAIPFVVTLPHVIGLFLKQYGWGTD